MNQLKNLINYDYSLTSYNNIMESEFEEQSRLDFIKRIKSENIVRVYNEEWTVRPNRGIEIDFNRATNYLSRCHT